MGSLLRNNKIELSTGQQLDNKICLVYTISVSRRGMLHSADSLELI